MVTKPSDNRVTSPYGWRTHPITGRRAFHTGTDYSYQGPTGRLIRAPIAGRITFDGPYGGYGETTILENGPLRFLFGHTADVPDANDGDWVVEGQIIATIGSTGNSTGPHLHLELQIENVRQDPAAWFAIPTAGELIPITPEEEDMFSDNDRALLIAVKAALLDGVAEEGMARSRLDVIFESANRIRGARTVAGGAPNPEYVYGDVLQWIRTEIRAVGKADAKTLAAELAPLLGLPDVVAKISDADVDRLVKKLLDEQARRLTT